MRKKFKLILVFFIFISIFPLEVISQLNTDSSQIQFLPVESDFINTFPVETGKNWKAILHYEKDEMFEEIKDVEIKVQNRELSGGMKISNISIIDMIKPIFIFRGVENVKNGLIRKAIIQGNSFLSYNSKITIFLDSTNWVISTSGNVIEEEVVADGGSTKYMHKFIVNYELALQDVSSNQKQVLVSIEKLSKSGAFPRIKWVGDIDGDNKLDICIDTNLREIGAGTFEWFLSTQADAGQLVKKIFVLNTLGC